MGDIILFYMKILVNSFDLEESKPLCQPGAIITTILWPP